MQLQNLIMIYNNVNNEESSQNILESFDTYLYYLPKEITEYQRDS